MHVISNNVATSAYAASWFARRAGRRKMGVVLSLVGATAVSVGGWLGGHLSYAMGVGVDTTVFQHGETEWTYLAHEAEVQTGVLRAADFAGVPLLLTRTDDGIVALADRCTHRGAPLHEGELTDGCVVCPWHGSTYALDGSVVEGPATRPQPAYEVRITDGQVFARRAEEPRTLRTNPVGV
jgi:nitrite reductase/ring-hydroxylating ferredoxin subunit